MSDSFIINLAGDPFVIDMGENTAEAIRQAQLATDAAIAALAMTNYRSTIADGVADFAVGTFFSSAEGGQWRIYKRIAGSPFYQDEGDVVAPLTAPNNFARADSATAFMVQDAAGNNILTFDTLEAFTGYAGLVTKGKGRVVIGGLPPTGDDSTIESRRDIEGPGVKSHAFRAANRANPTAVDGAYADFDSVTEIVGEAGSPIMDHARSYQARFIYNRVGHLDEYNSFTSTPTVLRGTITNLFDIHLANGVITPGVVGTRIGLKIDAFSGATTNVGIFDENPNNYLLGNLQVAGSITGITSATASGEIKARFVHATGGAVSYVVGGGAYLGGKVTASDYAELGAYEWDGTTLGARGIAIKASQVLINAGSPTTSAKLEVNGQIVALTSLRPGSFTVGTVPSAAIEGAGAIIFVTNESGGAVHAFSDATNWRRVTDRAIIT